MQSVKARRPLCQHIKELCHLYSNHRESWGPGLGLSHQNSRAPKNFKPEPGRYEVGPPGVMPSDLESLEHPELPEPPEESTLPCCWLDPSFCSKTVQRPPPCKMHTPVRALTHIHLSPLATRPITSLKSQHNEPGKC